ncbi:MAG: hypothetical protein K0U74_17440 [Alphaproteobacteria bacterium]|nr:hypothetical protein [Alphaproteobacteria bacterium]
MSNSAQWFLIGGLVVALAALGYIYYQDENTISIETGSISEKLGVE